MKILMKEQVIDESVHNSSGFFGSLNNFDEVAVKHNIIRSNGVVCAKLKWQIVEEKHHANPMFTDGYFSRVLHNLPYFSIRFCVFEFSLIFQVG